MAAVMPTEPAATNAAMRRTKSLSERLRYLWYLSRRSPLTLVGVAIILVVLVMIVAAPVVAPYNPDKVSLTARLLPPSAVHWFGTDEVGRDLFSRVIYGARASCGAAGGRPPRRSWTGRLASRTSGTPSRCGGRRW